MNTATPRELYQDPELRQELESYWHTDTPVDDVLAALDVVADVPDVVAYVDGLRSENKELGHLAMTAIAALPSETIVENYGREALLWAAAHTIMTPIAYKHIPVLNALGGYDEELFEKSRRWQWERHHSARGQDILAQYALAAAVPDSLDQIDIADLVRDSARPGTQIDEKKAGDYELIPLTTSTAATPGIAIGLPDNIPANLKYNIWLDTISGAMLTYRGRPNALVGFAMNGTGELSIHQLQGINGKIVDVSKSPIDEGYERRKIHPSGLQGMDWRGVMVGVTEQVARNMNLQSLGIQTGQYNYWATRTVAGEPRPRLSKDAASRLYDIPARRMGFTRGPDGNWHRTVDAH